MTTQRRATVDDEEDDDGDEDTAPISGWGTSDFDATIFTHADATGRRFPPKPKTTAAVGAAGAAHQTANEQQQQQQQHDKRKTKKTLRESDPKSPRWNSECEDWHSRASSTVKIPKAQLVTTQITSSQASPDHHHHNNHPSNHNNNKANNNTSIISKTALVSREFAVSDYAVPTKLLQPKELSPNRRRDRRRPPRTLQQQTEPTKAAPGSVCKIVGLIDDDDDMELADLWRLPPAVRRSEAFREHHNQQLRKHHERYFLLPPLLHGSNSVDSLLSPLFRSDLEQKMKALPVPFGSHPIGQNPAVADTSTATTLNSSSQNEQLQEHYSSMRRSHKERQSRHNNKYKQEALHAAQVRCVWGLDAAPNVLISGEQSTF